MRIVFTINGLWFVTIPPVEYLAANIIGAIPVLLIAWLRPDLRRPMLIVGLLTMPLALLDLFYVPSYWVPKTLFNIPVGLEGVVFSFEMGALITGIYAFVSGCRFKKSRVKADWKLFPAVAIPPAVALVISNVYPVNITVAMDVGLLISIGFLLLTQRAVLSKVTGSSVSFGVVYFFALFIWMRLFPSASSWFTLEHLPRLFILGVPLYEIAFGFLFAAVWSNLYQLCFGYALVPTDSRTTKRARAR